MRGGKTLNFRVSLRFINSAESRIQNLAANWSTIRTIALWQLVSYNPRPIQKQPARFILVRTKKATQRSRAQRNFPQKQKSSKRSNNV
eukprot:5481551-Amphidinium_carterae.1